MRNLRTYIMTPEERVCFDPMEFVQRLKDAGFRLDNETCPVKITQPWDNVKCKDGIIIWRQWDS